MSTLSRVGPKGDLTMRHVQVFFLLWHTSGSFKRTGEWVGITQPAVSYALGSLENVCGFELFHRGKGTVAQPTSAAIRLSPYFDRAFRALNDLAVEIERARINPDFGLPFRKINVLNEPIDSPETDELAKALADGTAREDTEKKR